MNNRVNRNDFLSSALIWGSVLLLFAFLVYWNFDTYNRKKTDLIQDLEFQATLASSEVNDSLLFTFVKIISADSNSTHEIRTVRTMSKGMSIHMDGTKNVPNFDRDSVVITILDDHFDISTIPDTIDSYYYSSHDTCADMAGHYGFDENHFDPNDGHLLSLQLDDESLGDMAIEGFQAKLDENKLPNEFQIVEKGKWKSGKDNIAIDFSFFSSKKDNLSMVESEAIFTDYRNYLFGKMLPSFLTSLGLFLIVCGSFYMVFKSWKDQQQLNKIKNEFVSNMTHELKTPITTVGVALEALSDFDALKNPAKTKEYIDISKHELNRLNILVDKVLKMSMFEKGKSVIKLEEINLKGILDEILASMKLHFEKKNVSLEYTLSGTNFNMQGDKIHLTNVCYNLIDNAIKYSGAHPKIKIALGNHPEKLSISVSDNGVGIPKEYIGKVFHRFFRVPTNDHHDVKGHGLGLNYVQQIVEKHQGQISLESEEGIGTTFYIELPRTPHHA